MRHTESRDYSAELLPPAFLHTGSNYDVTDETPAPGMFLAGGGRQFLRTLITAIDAARETVLVCAFLLTQPELRDALLRAAERGVRPYLLTASGVRLGKVIHDQTGFDRRMADEHSELLNRMAGKVLVRTADHFHAKFLLVDPGHAGERGWVSTANFNPALIENLEFGYELNHDSIGALADAFNRAFWSEAEQELIEPNRLAAINPRQVPARGALPGGIYINRKGATALTSACVELVQSALHEICLCAYKVEESHPITRAVLDASRRGVTTTVFLRPQCATPETLRTLTAAGIAVFADERLHAKAIVADNRAIILTGNPAGSAGSLDVGIECDEARHAALQRLLERWKHTFPWRYFPKATVGSHLGKILTTTGESWREGEVVALRSHDLGTHKTKPALRLPQSAPHAHRVDFSWEITATKPQNLKNAIGATPRPFGSLGDKFEKK